MVRGASRYRGACWIALVLAGVAGAGCSTEREGAPEPPAPEPARSPEQFAERFEALTAVALKPVADDLYGTLFEEPEAPDRFLRFGTYTLVWSDDPDTRELFLGAEATEPEQGGIYWERVGDGYTASKPIGPRVLLQWVGGDTKETTASWDRIERAARAAYLGDDEALPAAERPCSNRNLTPLRGEPGECSVDGIPVTFGDGAAPLATPALEARALGVETAEEIGGETTIPIQPEQDAFVIVAYRVRNSGSEPIDFLRPQLRLGGRTIDEGARAEALLPESRAFPVEPGGTVEAQVAFDVDGDLAERARARGALVLPAARDEEGTPSTEIAQGWIRLSGVSDTLPETPQDPSAAPLLPEEPPQPPGPPDIDVQRGSGPAIGGTARRLFMANTYFPLPEAFVPGGVAVGSRAGGCEVPLPSARDKAQLLAAERRLTPRGRIRRPLNRQILLADCGREGRFAITFWERRPNGRLKLSGDEFVYRAGRWRGSPGGRPPGCRLPDAAAAVWQIDISVCDQRSR